MRVVVTGSEGQLGSALKLTCPADIEPVWLGRRSGLATRTWILLTRQP